MSSGTAAKIPTKGKTVGEINTSKPSNNNNPATTQPQSPGSATSIKSANSPFNTTLTKRSSQPPKKLGTIREDGEGANPDKLIKDAGGAATSARKGHGLM